MIQKSDKNKIDLAIGPMSPEIVESVFLYSHFYRKPLMLIASKNQVDHSGGYVNNWTTKEYMNFVNEMKKKNKNADVRICRDHCGPGFNGNNDMSDVYATIEDDINNGFDLMHIDFCHLKGSNDEKLEESKKAILHCMKLNPNIQLEVGTDENTGANYSLPNLAEWEREIDLFQGFCEPEFYVVQTGSLVMEINQVGTFNKGFTEKVSSMLRSKGLKLKEHNADYLSKEEINLRRGIVDAQNIAPQLGVVQTQTILGKCILYGVSADAFLEKVYLGSKWKKWMCEGTPEQKMPCAVIAGHYHFASSEYKKMIDELSKYEDINETIINNIMDVIHHYVS
jgi:hypothetical protein